MKNIPSKRAPAAPRTASHLQRKMLAAVVATCFIGAAQAYPSAPQVVAGQASFNQQGNLFSITNTPNTIINWQGFSIGANEITRFIQQNADSKVLNRITGQDPSQILGALQSNGKVFLINPNGVMFGAGSRVDVNGLVASSLNIGDADFLAGKNNFTGGAGAGKVVNQGRITTPGGGQVYLIAPHVDNSGIITSPNGDIVLAAGESVQLVDSSNPDVHVQISAPADQALNLGSIVARGGRIGIYGALVNQRGRVSADSAVLGDAGQIILKSSGTTLLEAGSTTTATGANGAGGSIELLGPHVGLTGNASVDASGASGGGSVLVGGDRQGLNPAVQNAQASYVGSGATISADAGHGGNGGKVIVWGDDATRMYGSISARGGAAGGNGGLVETSGHYLDVDGGRVSTGAPHGQVGEWLLDPWNLTVVASGGTTSLASVAEFDSSTSGSSQINTSTINASSSNVTLSANNDLTFNSGVTLASGLSLTGQAKHDIIVNAPLITSGAALTLNANQGGGGGKIVSNASGTSVFGDLESGGGAISLNADSVNIQAPINTGGGTLSILATANTGAITLAPGTNGAISAASATIAGGPVAINGHLVMTSLLDVNAGTAAISSNGNALIAAPAVHAEGGVVTLANLTSITNSVSLTGSADSGDFTASATGGMFIASGPGLGITSATAIRLTAGALGITEDSGSRVAAPILQLTTPGIVSLGASASNQIGALEGTSLGALSYRQDSSASLTLGAESRGISLAGGDQDLQISTGGALSVLNNVNSAGNALHLSGSTIHVYGTATVTGGTTTVLTANGAGILGGNGSITLDSGSKLVGNNLNLSANEMTLNGTISTTPFGSDSPSSVTLTPYSPSRNIVVGATAANVDADSDGVGGVLGLSQAGLLNITTNRLIIGGNPNGDSGALSMSGALNLGAGSTKLGALTLQGSTVSLGSSLTTAADLILVGGNSISNAGTLTAKSLVASAGSISNTGTLAANSLTFNADQLALGTINAGNGAGTVNVNAASEGEAIEFSGASPTDSGALHINVADLAHVSAGTLNFSADSISVLSPISLTHTNLSFTANAFFGANSGEPPFDVEALVSGRAVTMTSAGSMLIGAGGVSGSVVSLSAGDGQPSTLTVGAPVIGTTSATLSAYSNLTVAAGGSVSAPLVSLAARDNSDERSTLTVAGSVTATGGTATLTGDSVTIASTGSVAASTVSLQAVPVNTNQSMLQVDGSVSATGGTATLTGETITIGSTGSVAGSTVALQAVPVDSGLGTLTVAGSVSASGGTATLTGDSITIASTGSVAAPRVSIQAVPVHTDQSTLQIDGSVSATGSAGNMVLSGSSLTVGSGAQVSAGANGNLDLKGDTIALGADVTAGLAAVEPYTTGLNVTLGFIQSLQDDHTLDDQGCANGPCLAFHDLAHVNAPTIGIGSAATSGGAHGDITVVGISSPGFSATTDRNVNTTRIGLLSGGAVSQINAIDVNDLGIVAGGAVTLNNAANHVASLAVAQSGCVAPMNSSSQCDLSFADNRSLAVARLSGILNDGSLYDINGIRVSGNVNLTVAGALTRSQAGAASDAWVTAVGLNVASTGGVGAGSGDAWQPLKTSVQWLEVGNTSATGIEPINLQNVDQPGIIDGITPLKVVLVSQVGASNHGAIRIDNTGQMNVGDSGSPSTTGVLSVNGDITLQTHSPMFVYGEVRSSGSGAISLSAGPNGTNDTLTLAAGSVVSTGGTIALLAGDAIVESGSLSGTVSSQSGVNSAGSGGGGSSGSSGSGAPTLDACVHNPQTPGCAAVLPTLGSCVTNPLLQGCSVVLPTLAQCTVAPTTQGCSVVLPTLGSCTTNPTAPGCSAVLPTLGSCTANPAASGCSAVLPTLASCTANPTLPGCSAVLPTLAGCTANPTLPGCAAVLPTLASCSANPTLAGCSAVLPSLAACVANPAAPACALVLPSLASCVASPALAGCSAVLPSLASCAANPTAAGCSAVLPTLAACVANPAVAGCGTVLPSVAQCVGTPSLAGCSAVLPSVAQCTSNPALAGCSSVLPPTAICSLAPNSAACQALIPPVASQSTPNAPLTVALNQTVQLINTSTQSSAPNSLAPPASGGGGGGSGSTSGTNSSTGGNAATSTNPGVANDTAKKMYCN